MLPRLSWLTETDDLTKTKIILSIESERWQFALEFCHHDLWFGVYWAKTVTMIDPRVRTNVYLGIPFLVLHISRWTVWSTYYES